MTLPRFANNEYSLAICLKDNDPIGYIKVDADESHDLGYALRKEFWHKGIELPLFLSSPFRAVDVGIFFLIYGI